MPRQPDRLPDWFVGGAGKRRLLRALVAERIDGQPWSKAELARTAGLHEKHTVFRHLDVLVLAGLLVSEPSGYRRNERSQLLQPLRDLISELDALPDEPLPRSRGAR